jgi:hypothetical protein
VAALVLLALVALDACVGGPSPRIGTAVPGDSDAVVSWQAPPPFAVTAYVVTPWIGLVAQPPIQFNSTATTETVTGLTNGTTYAFTVKAINAFGDESASSNLSNPVTPEVALPSSFVAHYTGPTDDGSYGTNGDLTISGAVDPVNGCSVANGCNFDVTSVTGTWHSADICGPGMGGNLSADPTNAGGTAFIETTSNSSTGFDAQINFTDWSMGYACPGTPSEQFVASTGGPPYQPWQPGATHTDWGSLGGGTFSIDWNY